METAFYARIRQGALLVTLAVFLIFSIILMIPRKTIERPIINGQNLKKIVTREGNTERTDYVDENGVITFAADAGYATMIATVSDSGRLERFYDAKGEPLKRYSQYYGILRSYDEAGRNVRNTYLGPDDEPALIPYGYSDLVRTFTDAGKIKTEKYYDLSGNPVYTSTFGCGLVNEYDEKGKKIKTTYMDAEDRPIVVGLGYASVTYSYYEDHGLDTGKAEFEFYFDAQGEPMALSLGQYGVHKAQYDVYGQNALTTYLDAGGKPAATKYGYSSVLRTYFADYRIETERYFDSEGNPFRMPDGQFGIKYENGQTLYLDQNGNEQFHIRRLLYNAPYCVILFALGVLLLSCFADRKMNLLLLSAYCIAIGYFTLMHRDSVSAQGSRAVFQLFGAFFSNEEARLSVLENIWLFIPLGAILFRLHPKWSAALVPAALSILIEGIQYFTGTGYGEADDVICNSLGGCIGYGAGHFVFGLVRRYFNGKRMKHTQAGSFR